MRTAQFNFTPLAPLALLAASLACPFAAAQPNAAAQPQPNRVVQADNGQAKGRTPAPVLSVEFDGGTLGQFVDAVKAATTETINVVIPADAMNLSVPRLSLKNVSPYMALQSLEYINQRTAREPSPQISGGSPWMSSEIKVEDLNQREHSPFESARTFAIVYTKRDRALQGPIDAQTTQVFAVRDLLATDGRNGVPGLTLDQIVQPIETTLTVESDEMRAGGEAAGVEPARLMVHKDSNLVIVKGTARQNALVKQVLDRLKDDVEQARSQQMPERERVQLTEEMRQQYEVRQMTLQKQLAQLSDRTRELRAVLEKATNDKNELAASTVQSQLRQAELSTSSVVSQLEQARQQAAEVEFEAKRQMRMTWNGNTTAEVRALRDQIDQLRKQLEELKGTTKSSVSR